MDSLHADIRAIAQIDSVPLMLDVVCRITGMGFAAVARVTDTQWIACSVKDNIGFGLEAGGELHLETTICDEIRQSGQGVVFDNADEDPVFCNHHTPKLYGLKSYISLPIVRGDGSFFGTLCAIDPQPHKVNSPETIGMFKLFAELIAAHLDQQGRFEAQGVELAESRSAVDLREQFIAVLGHDLRNPVAAISNAAQLLEKGTTPERAKSIGKLIAKSAFRIGELVDNLMDYTRGRLGGEVGLNLAKHETLEPALGHVINELRAVWPDREVQTRFSFKAPVMVDADRIGQMLSNLVGNAFTHGDATKPVSISATSDKDMFLISVCNGGNAISPATMGKLFKPFTRGSIPGQPQGLGLGLYIASEIARAHSGDLSVSSSDAETVFRFRMAQPK